jgi:hypothetical protein
MAIMYAGSDGKRYSETMIRRRYAEALKDKHQGNGPAMCEAYPDERAVHNDHTISQKRCKQIHKTELIWNPDNFVSSSARAHTEWEAIKGGEWLHHANVDQRLKFLKEHDPEGFDTRINLVSLSLQQQHDNA